MIIFYLTFLRYYINYGFNFPYMTIIFKNLIAMESSSILIAQKTQHRVRRVKYNVVSLEILQFLIQKRRELIKLVIQDQHSIYAASIITDINNATAKVIVRKFRETGTIFTRKSQKKSQQKANRITHKKHLQIDQDQCKQQRQQEEVKNVNNDQMLPLYNFTAMQLYPWTNIFFFSPSYF